MRKALLGFLVVAVLAVAAWLVYDRVYRGGDVPDEVLAAENALLLPGTVALASANVAALADLAGDSESPAALAGLPLHSVTHAVASLYATEAGRWGTSLVLFGSFQPASVEAALRAHPNGAVREATVVGKRVLYFGDVDLDRCDEAQDWALWLEPDRILLSDAATLETAMRRLAAPTAVAGDLEGFRAFRAGHAAALALFVPTAEPTGIEQPFLRAAAEGARRALTGFRELYVGASPEAFPAGIRLEAELHAKDPAAGLAEVQAWLARQTESKDEWQDFAPKVAALHGALALADDPGPVRLRARLERDWLEQGAALPAEIWVLIARGLSAPRPEDPDSPGADQIDPRPAVYRSHYRVSDLPRYDAELPLAGSVDAQSGPFGIRVLSLSRSEAEGAGLEITLEAIAPVLRNLREDTPGPHLELTSVRGRDERELLREEPCGAERNRRPAELVSDYSGELIRVTKTLRLRSDATLAEIEKISGEIAFTLPVHTESVRFEEPQAGDSVSLAGATLELTGLGPGSFSYRVSGSTHNLLAVRALNRLGTPLASPNAWRADLPTGGGAVAAKAYRGELSSIEAVFAHEQQEVRFPVELDSARPGSAKEQLATESVRFIEYSEQQFLAEFGPGMGRPFDPERPGHALTTAGPFTVVLEDLPASDGLTARIGIVAPDIPNLSYNLTGLELRLDRIGLRDGAVHDSGARTLVLPRRSFGREELIAVVEVATGLAPDADVERVDGELRLRLSQHVQTVTLADVAPGASGRGLGVELRVADISRDGLVLELSGDANKLVAVQAFNDRDQELLIENARLERRDSGGTLSFQVHGQPVRIAAQLARSSKRFVYGFSLKLPEPVPAARLPEQP